MDCLKDIKEEKKNGLWGLFHVSNKLSSWTPHGYVGTSLIKNLKKTFVFLLPETKN